MRKRFIIGIDPGIRTGFAVFDSNAGALIRVETLTFWTAHDAIFTQFTADETIIRIENPNRNIPVWRTGRSQISPGEAGRAVAIQNRVASSVGKNKAHAQLLIERFESWGFEVEQVKPSRRKWSPEEFRAATRWALKSSEHSRDAASLIYRR
jgi:hypothetical protein